MAKRQIWVIEDAGHNPVHYGDGALKDVWAAFIYNALKAGSTRETAIALGFKAVKYVPIIPGLNHD
jgi:hypothetical protein